MWPMYVDYSDDECKRLLRSLELEAYSAIISAFRAQGCLTKDKRKMLHELCTTLSISVERHRAEIRRAVNDEHLNTVAERLYGPNTSTEWSIEGRRVVPLMQRLAPQTVFTDIANSAANAQATKNASLPLPGRTGLREISNGVETMASRKRKEISSDPYIFPSKIQARDNQPFSSMSSFDSPGSQNIETPHVPEIPATENLTANEASSQETPPLSNYISSEIPSMAHVPSLVSPVKSNTKHVMKSSTVTTFSSFDQMTTNLLTSKPPSRSPLQSIGHEGHLSSVSDILKPISEPKSLQRSSSAGAMRTTVIPNTVPSTGSTSSSDRSSSSVPSQSKFVSQLRSKPPVTGRQNLPSGLGVKLNIQPPVTQRAMSPKTSGSKLKSDSNSGSSFLTKKASTGVFASTCQPESTSSQFALSESLTITKAPPNVQKSPVGKAESQTASSHQTTSKVPVTKSLPKASTSSSQYISRSLFGSGTKGAKTLPPVIFNVSTSTASHQTSTKTTGPAQSEAGKVSTSAQLLPKSTAIGVSQSHMKLSGPTTQTIQYRNDGGLVRSARIINVTPPAGSRLPCSITPSAISALGLSSNLTSGALRVTLPAGTLNTSSSMRASAVAKPNVIVVHKAQMWPRSQGAAVIMSSTPMQRISGDSNQENSSQKQEKGKPSTTSTATSKPSTRPHSSPRPQSPIVSSTALKVAESSSVRTSSPNAIPQTDSPASKESLSTSNKNTSTTNINSTNSTALMPTKQKSAENINEAQCKKNLLADVIEESGLSGLSPSKEKDISAKKEKEQMKQVQKSLPSNSSNETPIKTVLDSSTAKPDEASIKFDKLLMETMQSTSDGNKNGQSVQMQDKVENVVIQSTEILTTIQSSESANNTVTRNQTEDSKDQNT